MHRVGLVAADQRIERLQPGHLLPQVSQHDRARGPGRGLVAVAVAGGPPFALGQRASQRTRQLGRAGRRPQPVPAQPRVGVPQQPAVTAGQLDLHLVPLGYLGGRAQRLGRDVIRRDLGQRVAGRVDQGQHLAAGIYLGHRAELPAPGVHPDQPGQFLRYRLASPAEWPPDLPPGVAAQRQLQMPAGITAAAAPPQGDPVTDQPQVVGVVVVGPQHLLLGPRRGRYPRQASQARQGAAGPALILPFGFLHGTHRAASTRRPPVNTSPVVFGPLLLGSRFALPEIGRFPQCQPGPLSRSSW